MEAIYVQRLRLRFRKFGPARWISHLDLARTLERAFNRSKLPVAYTQGFNRRPRMQFATALPLGYTSEAEIVDVLLMETLDPAVAHEQIMAKMAPGIEILSVVDVDLKEPSLQAQTTDTRFMVTIVEPIEKAILQERVADFLAAESIVREKKGKSKRGRPTVREYDIRPLVIDLQLSEGEDGALQLMTHLHLAPSKTGRPDEVVSELGLDPLDVRAHRTHLGLESEF